MKKILVVDDDLDYLAFLVTVLGKEFEIYVASGVKEALQVLGNIEIDEICSDYSEGWHRLRLA